VIFLQIFILLIFRSDGGLVISTVLASDKGTYTCEVSNGIGQPVAASANLVVHCKFEQGILTEGDGSIQLTSS